MASKFNLNRQPIPDEDINSHKDFGELVSKFKKQSIEKARSDVNFLKDKKATYSAIIAGVAVICTVTYFAVFKKQPPKENVNDKIITLKNEQKNIPVTKQNKAFIVPPIAKLNVPYTSYKVKAEQGATIKHKSDSKIIIPKKAFVNKHGQDIIGDVQIEYREFHNQADIIASGIPMSYDSAGVKTTFESAGMVDIRGYQKGEPIFINPKKQITVEFSSEHPADRYNMYDLDTIARNWVYISRDNSLVGKKQTTARVSESIATNKNTESPKTIELQNKLDAIPPKIEAEKIVFSKKVNQLPKIATPSKPAKGILGRPQFELDVDYKEFPELAAFKNAVFEVGTENANYNSKLADVTWSSAQVTEGPTKGKNYLLTLKLRERTEKLIVYPVLTGSNYDNALKSYETKFNDYKSALAKREADGKRLKEEFEAKQVAYAAEQKMITKQMIEERIRFQKQQEEQFKSAAAGMNNEMKVIRIFNIASFGISNSDCPTAMPDVEKMNPIYTTDNKGTFIKAERTYLVCHSKNVVFNFSNTPLSYDPKDTYSLCIISNGKMYLCDKAQLGVCFTNKQNKIPVKELSADVNDPYELKKALGI